MKTVSGVFGSDLVNRYGMIMPVSVLESSLRQSWDKPLPSSIGHDIHRATGWVSAIALHLQPHLARVFGAIHYAESEKELQLVRRVLEAAISRQIEGLDSRRVAELRARVRSVLSPKASLHAQSCAAFVDHGLARRAAPALFETDDKHGLVKFRRLKPVGPGVFEHDGLLFFAHRFFRRSLSHYNTLNDPFLARLARVAEDDALDIRIALDEDMVGHPDTLLENIELQYWWGPKFSDDLSKIVTGQITRHEAGDAERFFNAIAATEFWWYEQGGRKTFECEELRDLNLPSLGQSAAEFGCRFIHSIVDPQSGRPVHLDGAVRLYSEDLMLERVDKTIFQFGRKADYTKLWRIDGLLDVPVWKALINDYYRDNHLPGEYFGGVEEDDADTRPRVITLAADKPLHEFVPCTMSRGDGVRISISYHEKSETAAQRTIVPTEWLRQDQQKVQYVEPCTIEIVKLVKRRGETIDQPANAVVLAYEDTVTNLPLIEHGFDTAPRDSDVTLDVIREYCTALSARRQNRMMTFHIGTRFFDRDVHYSFAGHVDDLCVWLDSACAQLPRSTDDIGKWAEEASSLLKQQFPAASDVPPLENMIKLSGLLTVDRKFLRPEEYRLIPREGRPPDIGLTECDANRRAIPLIKAKRLVITNALVIKGGTCKKCGQSYATCGCVKFVDADVTQEITDAELVGVFWTDRSAW